VSPPITKYGTSSTAPTSATATGWKRAGRWITKRSSAALDPTLRNSARISHERVRERFHPVRAHRTLPRPDDDVDSRLEEAGRPVGEHRRLDVVGEGEVDGPGDLGLIASDGGAVVAEDHVELEPVGRRGRERHVPLVGEPSRGTERAPAPL